LIGLPANLFGRIGLLTVIKDMSASAGNRCARRLEDDRAGPAGDDPVISLAEPLLDCGAAAELLNVRVSWVRDAARVGQLPCLRVGRHLRFTRSMLEGWLAGQLHGSQPPALRARRSISGAELSSRSGRASGAGGAAADGGSSPSGGRRSAARSRGRVDGGFRHGSQAALIASLAERPDGRKGA
jgi:excisionase family DNA binding protein